MFKGIAVALCGVSLFLFAACGSKPAEPIDPVRVAFNRIMVEKCLKMRVRCVGGFVRFSAGDISRLEWGEPQGFRTYGMRNLEIVRDFNPSGLSQIEFVLPDNPEWEKTAIAYARQFVERRRE